MEIGKIIKMCLLEVKINISKKLHYNEKLYFYDKLKNIY